MGFDMYVCDDNGETLRPEGIDLYDSDYYLRRGMGSAHVLSEGLVSVGMAYWPHNGVPDFPESPGREHFDEDYDPVTEEGHQYRKLVSEHLRNTYDERPGIAAHKLCQSNDGWWVTRAECASALQLWERAGQPEFGEWDYGDVLPFLRRAAQHGGFRVF